jgi:hypothetical protein
MFTELPILSIVYQSLLIIGVVVVLIVLVRLMLAATTTQKAISRDLDIRLDLLLAGEDSEPE